MEREGKRKRDRERGGPGGREQFKIVNSNFCMTEEALKKS